MMDKVDPISPLVEELDGLAKKDHKEEGIKDVGLVRKEEDIEYLRFEIEEIEEEDQVQDQEEEGEEEEDEDEHQEEEVEDDTGETVYGIKEKEEGEEKEDKVDHISVLELDEAEKEVAKEMEMDLDDDDGDDFEKVEELTLPFVSNWDFPDDGPPIHGLEVPVMKEDEFIQDSMYRNDIEIDDIDDIDPPLPPHVFDPLPPPPAPVCSICRTHWTPLHHFCFLPCGHIFGAQCIENWLKTNLHGTCPQCKALCSLKDVRPLYATRLCIPAATIGVADPEICAIRFPFSKQGSVKFTKFESGRRNFALKKRSDAKKRLAGVVGRKNDLLKRRTDLLDRRASVLNRAKALEQRGGSLCRVDALRLRADALGRWADEYLRRAKACEGRAEALSQMARAYNQRVKAFEARLRYFRQSCDNHHKNTTHCAAAATCHKD